ncbi:sugar phosphate isomerase/epimerase [Salinibacterium sp. CAN_S4]|uniref:sugar phosphate isomerase/epimerase family protein n=1 Tax=Salinibacterium sp. CAN_S4 TaxID=2787727 RepID=UPI0018F01C97
MSQFPLSVQLYTVRGALASDPAAALERIAGLGFTTVELFGILERVDMFEELLPRFGLTPSSAHATLLGTDLVPVLDAARRLGVKTVIDPNIRPETWTDSDAVVRAANELNSVARVAADLGITVGYHNHWWEFGDLDGTTGLEAFADNLDPSVVLEVDTYWAQVGGVSAVGLLERLGDRVRFLHVKDGDISKDDKAQVAVGNGRMPVAEVLAAAPQALRVIELDDFEGDVFDALADSVTFLRSLGETLSPVTPS